MYRKIKRAPNPRNSEPLGQPRNCLQHGRQKMGVLVRIQMRRLNAGAQHTFNLRFQFRLYRDQAPGDRAQQRWNILREQRMRGQRGSSAHQHQMDANIQRA